jgi:hypothetical protein
MPTDNPTYHIKAGQQEIETLLLDSNTAIIPTTIVIAVMTLDDLSSFFHCWKVQELLEHVTSFMNLKKAFLSTSNIYKTFIDNEKLSLLLRFHGF